MDKINYTDPQLISVRPDGLKEFHFKLSGLVVANCIHYSKNIKDTIKYAKSLVKSYMKRSDDACELSNNQRKNMTQSLEEKKDSGWVGITWNSEKMRWSVVVTTNRNYVGRYITLSSAIQSKRKANIRNGLPEFTGRK